ncbi:superfamily II DNA or RNA helicase [Geodermatophilus normandii]|uniref:Superfamily II DNA or RNA helicase n=1 Tax=Geodermatophilus normandii TaxID=1137989 RepID=A0A317QPC6_9ACTN|nr:DEAD/DEAH box helicase [Geodermatophilus normandii]PWW23480.1 superfamily II DNA or RNA helicase [Geodermatophilus normandii]
MSHSDGLRVWQREALAAWEVAGRRGIIAAATGTGKTRLALAAAAETLEYGRTVVVIPRIALVEQWVRALRSAGVPHHRIGTLATGHAAPRVTDTALVCVMDSAREAVPHLGAHWSASGLPTMLIIDECHWAGSQRNADIFTAPYDRRLGLSATPERLDDGLEDVLIPSIGDIVYRYPLRAALDDRLLADLLAVNVYVDLDADEQREYDRLTQRMSLRSSGGAGVPSSLDMARRRLVSRARARRFVVHRLSNLGLFDDRRALVFHERIEDAEETFRVLHERGHRTVLEHSKLPPARRARAVRAFKSGGADALVTVRTMDEGVDIPDADLGVIVSGGLQQRQRIQRIGRLLRAGGTDALCVTALARATTEEHQVGSSDEDLLGPFRVRHHLIGDLAPNWRPGDASTYKPNSSAV